MTRFYEPDLSVDLDSPFVRDAANKLIRRSYWLDMDDRSFVRVMVSGVGSHLTNDEKRAHSLTCVVNTSSIKCAFRKFFRPRDSEMQEHRRRQRGGVIPACHAQTLEGKMTSKEVEQAIRALGLAVARIDGKWRINYRGGKEGTAYYTTDDDDALGMARAMEVARGHQ
jgi:hypothetical protein